MRLYAELCLIVVFSLCAFLVLKSSKNKNSKQKWGNRKALNITQELYIIDEMEGHRFEYYCANLLEHNGFSKVTVTKGSGDNGLDIIGYSGKQKWGFQCKRYDKPVGRKAVYEAFTGQATYRCDKVAIITNNLFTRQARETAYQTNVLLWDRSYLMELLKNANANNVSMRNAHDLWPHNRNTSEIDYGFYANLPPVPKRDDLREYIKCWPIDGADEQKSNPYIDSFAEEIGLDYMIVEIWCGYFRTEYEAQHSLDALTKRYYALSPNGVHSPDQSNPGYSFAAYIHGDLIKSKFDQEKCCWILENWADNNQ